MIYHPPSSAVRARQILAEWVEATLGADAVAGCMSIRVETREERLQVARALVDALMRRLLPRMLQAVQSTHADRLQALPCLNSAEAMAELRPLLEELRERRIGSPAAIRSALDCLRGLERLEDADSERAEELAFQALLYPTSCLRFAVFRACGGKPGPEVRPMLLEVLQRLSGSGR